MLGASIRRLSGTQHVTTGESPLIAFRTETRAANFAEAPAQVELHSVFPSLRHLPRPGSNNQRIHTCPGAREWPGSGIVRLHRASGLETRVAVDTESSLKSGSRLHGGWYLQEETD